MSFRDSVKPYFVTGAYPTQAQFWDMLDKLVFHDEGINRITTIGGPQLDIPADTWIDKIGFVSPGAISVTVGTTLGGNDVLDNEPVSGTASFERDIYFENEGTLYFSGIFPNTKILIFKR